MEEKKVNEQEKIETRTTQKPENWVILFIAALIAAFVIVYTWIFSGYNRNQEKSKSDVADSYKVSNLTLMK